MQKTKIEWCDMTWNPVTGCRHDCEYCYARTIAKRFCGNGSIWKESFEADSSSYAVLDKPFVLLEDRASPYPFGFVPTFHRYRLDEPAKIKKPQNIFVCSMSDLFGEWVPDEWIKAVFKACGKAPQHRYLFLTKNSKRFRVFQNFHTENIWFGQTITGIEGEFFSYAGYNTFLSIEPLLGELKAVDMLKHFRWVIIGAETGNRKGKVIPNIEWIVNVVYECRKNNIPVFMKNSLRDIWKEPLVQEYPWKEAI